MFTAILAFIGSPIGKVVSIVALIGSLASVLFIGLKIHDSSVRSEALLEYNQKQLQTVVDTQQKTITELEAISKIQTDIVNKFNTTNETIDSKTQTINQSIDNSIKNDRESSDVLKNTIRQLQGN